MRRPRATEQSLLMGILYDDKGNRFTPSHTNKKGQRYRYYVSQAIIKNPGKGTADPVRLPAQEIETLVASQLTSLLQSPQKLLDLLGTAQTEQIVRASREWAGGTRLCQVRHGDGFTCRSCCGKAGTVSFWRKTLRPLCPASSRSEPRTKSWNSSSAQAHFATSLVGRPFSMGSARAEVGCGWCSPGSSMPHSNLSAEPGYFAHILPPCP